MELLVVLGGAATLLFAVVALLERLGLIEDDAPLPSHGACEACAARRAIG